MLGELTVMLAHSGMSQPMAALCQRVAKRCGHLIKRHEARAWAEERMNRSSSITGVCDAVWQLDEFVERVAHTRLPALLRGEFGTETDAVALMLHAHGPLRDGPFVTINCADPAEDPAAWFKRAAGGTLFLQDIDELDAALQRQVPERIRLAQIHCSATDGNGVSRVIASTTAELRQRVRAGRFSRTLLSQLDFMAVELPTLRNRRDDLEFHLARVLALHGFDACHVVTDALMDAVRHYHWPENLLELERVIVRLAVMTGGKPIEIADIQRYAPSLTQSLLQRPHDDLHASVCRSQDAACEAPKPTAPDDWIADLPHRQGQRLATLHDALRRALVHLGEHYAEPLTLGDLARQAHVSQSHLGFLFREELGTTFKPLLQRLRIQKAKELLHAQQKLRITEVALKVGFGDLSHFEKSFRRLVGICPRQFRKTHGGGEPSPPSSLR
ncbi:helix-turn-helix domain-containing protein [Xanthomonas sp. 3058]|uniref:helix-turn-helix domain-containing protein n=1 Tax=Xanthomonas sp. 3058 TaxID=3035314 RepID=UPI002DD635FB|nr:helix-turn-helix domain-containing protein [Xanthomonas sp. 3058]